MTKRQTEYFDWIKRYIEKNGASPAFWEIRDGLGVASLATVSKKVIELQHLGVISYRCGLQRSIEIVEPKTDCLSCIRLSRELAAVKQELADLQAGQ
jgi:SOS-response transcriptional repressor LexA